MDLIIMSSKWILINLNQEGMLHVYPLYSLVFSWNPILRSILYEFNSHFKFNENKIALV